MEAELLDGNLIASRIKEQVRERALHLRSRGATVGLGTILVGDDGPSARYVEMKRADCAEVGIESFHTHLPASASEQELADLVQSYNADSRIHSYLVQLPLPPGHDEDGILTLVKPEKDVDGLHPMNLGYLAMSRPRVLPCTPAGIVELLRAYGIGFDGKHVVILGRGLTIGRPLALLLALNRPGLNAAVTVVHSRTRDLAAIVKSADIVISATGAPGIVTASMVKRGAVVVGAGTSFAGRKLLSDLADDVAEVASWVTPRIGGVGPMTRAMLLLNAVMAAEAVAGAG